MKNLETLTNEEFLKAILKKRIEMQKESLELKIKQEQLKKEIVELRKK